MSLNNKQMFVTVEFGLFLSLFTQNMKFIKAYHT